MAEAIVENTKENTTIETIKEEVATSMVKELTVDERIKNMLLQKYKVIELTNGAMIVKDVAPFRDAKIDSISVKKLAEIYEIIVDSETTLPIFIEKLDEEFGDELKTNDKILNILFDIILIVSETRGVAGRRYERTELGSRFLTVKSEILPIIDKIIKIVEEMKRDYIISQRKEFIENIKSKL